MTRRGAIRIALVAGGLIGCVGAAPGPVPLAQTEVVERLNRLTSLDRRVARVTWRLAVSNADVCPRRAAAVGWALHAANLYSLELRPPAMTQFGLTGDLPGVLDVAPGGPAAAAGVRAGDLILAVDGRTLDIGRLGAAASYDGFAANVALVDSALAKGATHLTLRRGDVTLTLDLNPISACDVTFQVNPTEDANAGVDDRRIFVTSALTDFAAVDDDLAVVLSHELSHIVLNHRGLHRRPARMPWSIAAQEAAADRSSVFLMARAGFDYRRAPDFWRRLGQRFWQARYAQWGHPSAEARADALDLVVIEVSDRILRGLPLGSGGTK